MILKNVALEAIEIHLPDILTSSSEIEQRLKPTYEALKLPEGRLELMTGIQSRGLWPTGTRPSDLATAAAKKVFLNHDINPNEIDLLIHASVCRDFLEPSTASVIHNNLELNEKTMIFDLSNACLGVLSSMHIAAQMIESGQIKKALIVSGENAGPLVEETISFLNEKSQTKEITRKSIKSYMANLTIGSGAVAIVLSDSTLVKDAPKITGSVTMTDSSANVLCQGDGNTHSLMMQTDSEALMHAGVKLAKKTWTLFQEKTKIDTPDWVITHQVGSAHEKLTLEALRLENIPTVRTYPSLGNTGSAALPLTLYKLLNEQQLQNKKVALLGIGSGLTSTMMGLQC